MHVCLGVWYICIKDLVYFESIFHKGTLYKNNMELFDIHVEVTLICKPSAVECQSYKNVLGRNVCINKKYVIIKQPFIYIQSFVQLLKLSILLFLA